ncbi:MAG: hypothetical protein ACOH1X_03025 [Kaistella sp.]
MEIKFFSNGKVLDLSGQKISVSESNSKVSDKMFTKYLFPFEIYMDDEFKAGFGDYASYDSYDLAKIIIGQLLYENEYREAKLEILNVEGDYLTGQIDFGFEEIPNFSKPLKELPLEKFDVDNIHTFAAGIAAKKYPQTNFNFPRLYYGRYSPDEKVWDAYNGFVNDMNDDGTALRNNYIDALGEIYNQNIVQPLPHILYLLKTGFLDAGYILSGDILTDPMLAQQWVFSGTEYFSRLIQRRYGFEFTSANFDQLFLETGPDDYAQYQKYNTVEKLGVYKIAGTVEFFKARKMWASYKILLNGVVIWSKYHGSDRQTILERIPLNFEFTVTEVNSVLEMYIYTQYHEDSWTHPISSLAVTSVALEDATVIVAEEDMGVITNLNRIDLTRAVPDITFGELVNRIRNFLNYDVTTQGNTIIMDKIGSSEPTNIITIPPEFLQKKPRRNILNKKSFLIRMPNWENEEKADSIFYDSSGFTINKEAEELTTVIETNTYVLPVYAAKIRGPVTGVVKSYDSSLLQLVKYDGKSGIQNNAKPSPELTFPELFYTNWEKWLRGRLRSVEFVWMFTSEDDQLLFSIKNYIGCYQNIHIIKELVKDYIGDSVEVNITTETVN